MRLQTSAFRAVSTAVFATFLLAAASQSAFTADDEFADIVFKNGRIYTVDPARSVKQALAVTGNTITAVGRDAEIEALVGPDTRVIDLGGKFVLPGLIDTHSHPILAAVSDSKCSLAGVPATLDAIRPVIRNCLADRPVGGDGWLEVVQLDNYGFDATAEDFDTIEAERPLAVGGKDGHTLWTNTRALALAGITAATADPPGGRITRDAAGNPTGAFVDTAMSLIQENIPPPPSRVRPR